MALEQPPLNILINAKEKNLELHLKDYRYPHTQQLQPWVYLWSGPSKTMEMEMENLFFKNLMQKRNANWIIILSNGHHFCAEK